MQRIYDLECNRCHGTYESTERTMSITVQYCILSICPKCTDEVAALMGFTKEEISKQLCQIKEAETENNRKNRIKDGEVCKKCHVKFGWSEARVRKSNASNVLAWHVACYTGVNGKEEASGEDA